MNLAAGPIEFDFGKSGEIDGFNVWRLAGFAEPRLARYGFETSDAIEESFKAALKAGALVSSGYVLYYVADSVRSLASEICEEAPKDMLPHREQDSVLVLHAKFFLAADLMRRNYEKLSHKSEKYSYLSQNDRINLDIYFSSWLGYLGAVCEAFKTLNLRRLLEQDRPPSFRELIVKCEHIGGLLKRRSGSLRGFRNSLFHLRDESKAILRLAADDAERLAWLGELHDAIAEFLYEYRMACEAHYARQGRRSESQIGRRQAPRGKTNLA
ncbi:MAG TPA: hypothetical protein VGN04_01640 [Herbaspirillum sp.]